MKKKTGKKINDVGLIILKSTPWFGFSPDSICNDVLIEIKCPKNNNKINAESLMKTIPYITTQQNNVLQLKKQHKYYGQIQLGLCFTNIKKCHFVVYEFDIPVIL